MWPTFFLSGVPALGVRETLLIDVQEFVADGTWTKPTGAVAVEVILLGGGGGGCGGAYALDGRNNGGYGGGGAGLHAPVRHVSRRRSDGGVHARPGCAIHAGAAAAPGAARGVA